MRSKRSSKASKEYGQLYSNKRKKRLCSYLGPHDTIFARDEANLMLQGEKAPSQVFHRSLSIRLLCSDRLQPANIGFMHDHSLRWPKSHNTQDLPPPNTPTGRVRPRVLFYRNFFVWSFFSLHSHHLGRDPCFVRSAPSLPSRRVWS